MFAQLLKRLNALRLQAYSNGLGSKWDEADKRLDMARNTNVPRLAIEWFVDAQLMIDELDTRLS